MIEVQNLTRYYGRHAAVAGLSFSIQDREIVGFLGLNGAGKSTTLKILAGLLLPSSGTVQVDGVDVVQAPDSLRAQIGYLPEDAPLYLDMRVRDFVSYVGQLKGMSSAEVDARIDGVLARCGLAERAEQVISELSHGYRKRVGIAQAIIHQPKLVILDEPISGLDPLQIREIREVIVGLKADCTVLISSHILGEISQTCDRILVLKDGKMAAQGTEEELRGSMGEGGQLELSIRGTQEAVVAALNAYPHTSAVTRVRTEDIEGGTIVHCQVALAADEREGLIAALVGAGLGLRRMDEADSELEAIFVNLTQGKG
jgi:ABC-2 type transport system ATP-binding protein